MYDRYRAHKEKELNLELKGSKVDDYCNYDCYSNDYHFLGGSK